jgi:hypothetical protein
VRVSERRICDPESFAERQMSTFRLQLTIGGGYVTLEFCGYCASGSQWQGNEDSEVAKKPEHAAV